MQTTQSLVEEIELSPENYQEVTLNCDVEFHSYQFDGEYGQMGSSGYELSCIYWDRESYSMVENMNIQAYVSRYESKLEDRMIDKCREEIA